MSRIIFICALLILNANAQIVSVTGDGVESLGYAIKNFDDVSINKVFDESEKTDEIKKKKTDYETSVKPLSAIDIKCLISNDDYCSKNMLEIKDILKRSVEGDCEDCSSEDRQRAASIVASMISHDPVAWKAFLSKHWTTDLIINQRQEPLVYY